MDYSSLAPSKGYELSKHFLFGIGVGLGAGIIIRKLINERSMHNDTLIRTLQRLIREIQTLRESLEYNRENDRHQMIASSARNRPVADITDSDEDEDDDLFEMAPTDTEYEAQENFIKGRTTPVDNLLAEVKKLQEGDQADKETAYVLLSKRWQEFPSSCEIMWRYAKSLCDHAELRSKEGKKSDQEAALKQGVEAGGKAIIIDDTDADAHKWFAILLGSFSEFQPTQDRILMGYKYKEHIEKAIKLKNDDPTTHSLLGRWCYEVYMLPWYMRKAAAALYATPPSATIDEALQHFLKAEKLRPGFWKTNTLFIGKCYHQKACYQQAKEWLLIGKDLPCKSDEDRKSHQEIEDLLRKL